MAHIPININSLGLLNGLAIYPISVNTVGFLIPGGSVIPPTPPVKRPSILITHRNVNDGVNEEERRERWMKYLREEDEEIMIIIKAFLKCRD